MNNWGGIKEHMTKKPRKFFGNKRIIKPIPISKTKKSKYSKQDFSKYERIKRQKIWMDVLIFLLVVGVIVFVMLFFVIN